MIRTPSAPALHAAAPMYIWNPCFPLAAGRRYGALSVLAGKPRSSGRCRKEQPSAHGTATVYNDEMEAIALNRMGLQHVPVNSLKGFYGHCLGASGLLETVISMESALRNTLIKSANFEKLGTTQEITVINENQSAEIKTILKTASGFGGCNSAVILRR